MRNTKHEGFPRLISALYAISFLLVYRANSGLAANGCLKAEILLCTPIRVSRPVTVLCVQTAVSLKTAAKAAQIIF